MKRYKPILFEYKKSKAISLSSPYDKVEYDRLVNEALEDDKIFENFIKEHKDLFEVLKQVKQLHYYDRITSGAWLNGKYPTLNLHHNFNGLFFISPKKEYEIIEKARPDTKLYVTQEMTYKNKKYVLYGIQI